MIRIRAALPDDAPELCRMARDFYAFAGCEAHGLGYDDEDFLSTVGELLATGSAALLVVAEDAGRIVGGLAAVLLPWYLKRSDLIGQELWFWVEPEARRGEASHYLLSHFEGWARAKGACTIHLATPGACEKEAAMQRLYRRWGYRYLETAWAKRVD